MNFPGSTEEAKALRDAVTRNCDCTANPDGTDFRPCASHNLLADEAALVRLIYVRRYFATYRPGQGLRRLTAV